jgi:hypothetical protein
MNVPCISGELITRIEWRTYGDWEHNWELKLSLIDELIIIIIILEKLTSFGSIKIKEIDLWEHQFGDNIKLKLIGTTFSCGWELSKNCEG